MDALVITLRYLRRTGLRTALAGSVALMAIPPSALADPASGALPTGGSVVQGAATISQSGNRLDIVQSTQRAIINWQSFDIGSAAHVNFQQPSSSSVALNRVVGQSPSQIFGKLTANGQVFLLNPGGVVIGAGGQVNVASLVASTMSMADSDFMAGNYRFSRNGSTGAVVNRGTLSTNVDGGFIALLAPELRNEAVIQARMGRVILAAGETVALNVGNRVSVLVDPATVRTLVENRAMIMAEGGHVILSSKALDTMLAGAINMSGVVKADSLVSRGGEVVLEASGAADVSGTISANGTSGGTVSVKGGQVALSGATVEAGGTTGAGGSIAIGDWTAQRMTVDAASTLRASAGQTGNGGSILAIGQDAVFEGQAVARGGLAGGDGGNIETSGTTLSLGRMARVDAGASLGKAGLWLIDPQDLTIDAAGATALATALATTSVTATTSACNTAYGTCSGSNGDISVASSINPVVTNAQGTTLTLLADRNIKVESGVSIDATGGTNKLNVTLTANNSGSGGGISVDSLGAIKTKGGDITMNGGGTGGYTLGVASLNESRGIVINTATLDAGGGNILLKGQGGSGTYAIGVDIVNQATVTTSGSGTITFSGIGGNSSGANGFSSGVNIYDRPSISTGAGAITITGEKAATSTNSAYAISFDLTTGGTDRTSVYSTSGDITLNGGSGSIVFATPSGQSKTNLGWNGSGSGTTGTVSLNADTVSLTSTSYGAIKGGALSITANTLSVTSPTTLTTTGAVTVKPYTSGTSLALGSGAGTLALTNTIIDQFQSGYSQFTFGSSSAGALAIDGAVSSFSAALLARSGGTITLGNGASLTDTASGDALTLVGNSFVNSGGSLSTANGRWLIYTSNAANDSRGSLSGSVKYQCSYGGSCAGLGSSGNVFASEAASPTAGKVVGSSNILRTITRTSSPRTSSPLGVTRTAAAPSAPAGGTSPSTPGASTEEKPEN